MKKECAFAVDQFLLVIFYSALLVVVSRISIHFYRLIHSLNDDIDYDDPDNIGLY